MDESTATTGSVRSAQLVDIPAVVRVLLGEHPADITPARAEAAERVTRLMLAHFALAGQTLWVHDHPQHGVAAVAAVMTRDDRPDLAAARQLLAREAPRHMDLLGIDLLADDSLHRMLPGGPETIIVLARTEHADGQAARATAGAALASLDLGHGYRHGPVGGVARSQEDLPVFASLGFGVGKQHLLPSGAQVWLCRNPVPNRHQNLDGRHAGPFRSRAPEPGSRNGRRVRSHR